MLFSDQIFEAIVIRIDYNRGVCSLSPIDANTQSIIDDVPLPHIAGNGSSGLFFGLTPGSRVIAMFTSAKTRDVTVIAGFVPKPNLYQDIFQQGKTLDTPNGIVPYPRLQENDLILRGERGAEIGLKNTGDILLKTVNGGGLYLKRNEARSSLVFATEDLIHYSNGGKIISGPVRRMSGIKRNTFPKPDLTQTPLFADPEYASRTVPYGFFQASRPVRRTYASRKRNPEISEYRMIINEFSTDYMFTGFDDEVARVSNDLKMFQDSETYKRNREQGNTLHLAEHELIEIVGGNLVDINGNILDLNYRPLIYGFNNKVPTQQLALNYDRARRISRRGIGYHFQLTTNTRKKDPSQTDSNFVFDIDKEGILKLHIPASSNTGNIPYVSNANFTGAGDSVEVSLKNQSKIEPIPVTLRDQNGEIVYPDKNAQNFTHRKTGVRYANGDENPYFPAENSSEVRVNSTRYHNMYAAAERLIANTIRIINIPQKFLNDSDMPEDVSVLKPFEIPIPSSLNTDEDASSVNFSNILNPGKTDFPTYMSVVAVEPGPSAIYSGGGEEGNGVGTVIAGKTYFENEEKNPPYSNAFNSSVLGDEVSVEITAGDYPAKPAGGKSANFDVEGLIEMSVGKDNYDQKSIVLDTAGSMIAWLGKDRNNRSMIMQTDGDFLLNVGGSYQGDDPNDQQMNKGRFELRVNVVDKKFMNSQFIQDTPERGGNPGAESDYIISISENGIIIGGMKNGAPMIFRNDGPILIESTSSDVTLKGIQVKTVDPKGAMNVIKPPTRN